MGTPTLTREVVGVILTPTKIETTSTFGCAHFGTTTTTEYSFIKVICRSIGGWPFSAFTAVNRDKHAR